MQPDCTTPQTDTALSEGRKNDDNAGALNRVRKELKESEERYRALFEYTGTAMIVIEKDMTITMANHRLEEFTGYSQEEILKRHKWTEFVVPEDIERMKEYHEKRRVDPQSVPSEYEFRLMHRDGTVRDMLINVTMIPGTDRSLVSLMDITRLKSSERALRESERRYRELFENANDIVFTTDLDGNFTSANIAALNAFGYRADDIGRTTILRLIDPAYHRMVMEKLTDRRSSTSSADRYEILARTRDGKAVWIELSTRLIREDGRPVGIQGIARDITERKIHQEQLEESRRRFKETADLLPGIICEVDLSMKLIYVNKMGLALFGFTPEDFERGISVLDLIPEHELERFRQDLHNVTHGDFGNPKLYELYRKDRSIIQLIINSAPIIKNGAVVGIRSSLTDISDRVRAEKQIRESEERFRSIYESSPIGIALYSPEGKLLERNSSFTRMFDGLADGFFPDPLFEAIKIENRQRSELYEGTPIIVESAVLGVSGTKGVDRHFEWHISAIGMPHGGSPSMYLAQVQDITARKEAQEARLQKEREATARAEALVAGLRRELREYTGFNNIVSRSPEMKKIFDILPEVAQAAVTVLICGESGTGKELIARSLHQLSNRKDKPFIAINCSALPDNLLESELFGYKAGAFTDAKKDKPGRFALAEGGTVFLDEIGDISQAMQVKLLRVLQEKVYEPLGAIQPVKADVRIVAATNKNLPDMVSRGSFREDLYYRLNVVAINLPPLRERRCDVPLLCNHFIERFNARYDKNIAGISDDALRLLMAHDFPGNIRELENLIEHAFIFCKSDTIDVQHLPASFREKCGQSDGAVFAGIKSFDELERMYIKSVLEECGGNKLSASQRLGIHKATLFRKLKQLGIK